MTDKGVPICEIKGIARDQEDFYRLKQWIYEELAVLAERRIQDLDFAFVTIWDDVNKYMEYEVRAYERRKYSKKS